MSVTTLDHTAPESDALPPLQHAIADQLARLASNARAVLGTDPATANQDLRSALRRTRALVDLVRGAISRSDRRTIRDALQQARSALRPAREYQTATSVLATHTIEDARVIIETAPAPDANHEAVAAGVECVTTQVETLRALLPHAIDPSVLVDGVKAVYRDARRARRAAKRSKTAFRRWHRRSKELAYQLDVLASLAGAQVGQLATEIEQASEQQRRAQDLITTRDFVRSQRDHLDRTICDRVRTGVDAELAPTIKDARRAGRAAFRRKPREFGKRLEKALRTDTVPQPAD